MNSSSLKNKILKQLKSERTWKRKSAIKKIPNTADIELIEYLILIVQIEEKEKIRKEAYLKLAKIHPNNLTIDETINAALEKAIKNEPNEVMKDVAKKALQNRKRN